MESKPIDLSCYSPDSAPVGSERRKSMKAWMSIAAAASVAAGMLFVQACSSGAKAGPNGGDLVELDDGKTSAEVLANADTGEVMVYTWDNDLESARPVEARPMTMGVDEKQLQLEPHPLASDPPGYCSRFYARADWLRGGSVRHGWLRHAGADTGRREFAWSRAWQAGKNHGPMWSEMGGHRPGMGQGGSGGMRHE